MGLWIQHALVLRFILPGMDSNTAALGFIVSRHRQWRIIGTGRTSPLHYLSSRHGWWVLRTSASGHSWPFMLRQFEIARSIRLRPYNALAFSAPIAVFVSVFLVYPLGQTRPTGRVVLRTSGLRSSVLHSPTRGGLYQLLVCGPVLSEWWAWH